MSVSSQIGKLSTTNDENFYLYTFILQRWDIYDSKNSKWYAWWRFFLTQIFKSWFVFWNLQFHRVSNRGMKKSITYLLTYNFRHQHIGKMFNNNSKNRSPPTLTLLLHFRSAIFFPEQKVVWQQYQYYHNNNLQKCTRY